MARFRIPRPAVGRAGRFLITLIAAVTMVAAVVTAGATAAALAQPPDPATCPVPKAAAAAAARGEVFSPARAVDQRRAVTLLFLPGPIRTPTPVLTADLMRLPGFAAGLFSPTIGRYSPGQMMLDISQGSRVASSLLKPVSPPAPGLIVDPRTATARFKGWNALIARADSAPADLRIGLLGCTVEKTGNYMAWTGVDGGSTETAIAAVAGGNGIRRVQIVPPNGLVASIEQLQRKFAVVSAELPAGGFGLGDIRRLAADQPERMMIVVQTPPNPARTHLLSMAVRGIGGDRGIRSASTRRDGLVAVTDVAATVIARIGGARPTAMQGRPIEPAGRMSADDLGAMSARLELIASRRQPFGRDVLFMYALLLAGVLAVGRISGRYDELSKRMQRLVGLSMLWLPALLLVTAALRPSRAIEVDLAVFGSLGLAMGTDRMIPWPRAPWLPVAAVLSAQAIDFALLGSRFIGQSLLGPNPLYGARFFGSGNELEAVLTVSALIAVGAVLCDLDVRRPARWFAATGVAMAMFFGLGRLGADAGGVITVGAGFGVAALYAARLRLTAGRLLLLALLPAAGLALIVLLDSLTGGQSHLTRTFQDAHGVGDILKVIERRFLASVEGAKSGGVWIVMLGAIALLAWGWVRRERLLAPLVAPGEDPARRRPYRAALAGGMAATVIGAMANDSGPAMMIIGTVYLVMGVLYLRGRPPLG